MKLKPILFLSPLILFFVFLMSGSFYVYDALTDHNFGFSYSKQFNITAKPKIRRINTDIRVLTYNVHGLPHKENPFCDNLIRIGQKLKEMRRKGTAPDIIAIQEGFHEKIHDLIEISGYPYAEQGPSGDKNEVTSGLWVLSEFPIKTKGTMVYKKCATWDCLANKGIQFVSILVNDSIEIRLFNTHMNAFPSHGDFFTAKSDVYSAKKSQIEEFQDYFNRLHDNKYPSILIGDFNIRAGNILFDFFFRRIPMKIKDTFAREKDNSVDHQFFVPNLLGSKSITPISLRRMFTSRHNSDHDGILVNYRVK